jgi:1,4-dihydroxy-2-naphthoyl-CoA synthase
MMGFSPEAVLRGVEFFNELQGHQTSGIPDNKNQESDESMNVRLTIENHVATVTLARPDSLNAVDSSTRSELEAIWSQLETSADVRVIVLTGAGERASVLART